MIIADRKGRGVIATHKTHVIIICQPLFQQNESKPSTTSDNSPLKHSSSLLQPNAKLHVVHKHVGALHQHFSSMLCACDPTASLGVILCIPPEHITDLNGRHWATYRSLVCCHVNTQVRKELRRPHCMLTYVSEGKIATYTPTTAWLRRVPAHAEAPHRLLAVGAKAYCHRLAACCTWNQNDKCICLR